MDETLWLLRAHVVLRCATTWTMWEATLVFTFYTNFLIHLWPKSFIFKHNDNGCLCVKFYWILILFSFLNNLRCSSWYTFKLGHYKFKLQSHVPVIYKSYVYLLHELSLTFGSLVNATSTWQPFFRSIHLWFHYSQSVRNIDGVHIKL